MNNINDFVIDGTTLIEYNGNDKQVFIPEGITTIAANAFCSANSVEYIHMSDSVNFLEENSIHNMERLKTIKLSANVKKIQNNFYNCDSIEKIDFLENIEALFSVRKKERVYYS